MGQQRLYGTVKLPVFRDGSSWTDAKVRRLTAPGVGINNGVTFAGRTARGDGNLDRRRWKGQYGYAVKAAGLVSR